MSQVSLHWKEVLAIETAATRMTVIGVIAFLKEKYFPTKAPAVAPQDAQVVPQVDVPVQVVPDVPVQVLPQNGDGGGQQDLAQEGAP